MGVIKKLWGRWLKVAEVMGNVQMIVLLSLVYWIFVTLLAIPVKLMLDPLALRQRSSARWNRRHQVSWTIEAMKKQY